MRALAQDNYERGNEGTVLQVSHRIGEVVERCWEVVCDNLKVYTESPGATT